MAKRRQGGGPLKMLAGPIGLAAEAIQHHRNKSKSPGPATNQTSQPEARYSTSATATAPDEPPPYSAGGDFAQSDYVFERDDGVTRHDEAIWELDEAADELDTGSAMRKAIIPKGVAKEPARISILVDAFLSVNQPSHTLGGPAPLPCPVIIPQRRPESRARGFVRAYSPYLEPCGVPEYTFMQFLEFHDESLKYSNAITVVKVAGGIVGLVPGLTTMAVSMALSVSAEIAGTVQSTQRSNDFITRLNQQYFMPMGLVCMVVKFAPDRPDGGFDVDKSVANASQKVHPSFRSAHGKTNEAEIPYAAPLVFPTLDNTEDKEKLSKFQRSMRFITEYQDRRAHAKFEMDNPDSKLAASMQGRTTFESSLADPRNKGNGFNLRGGIHSAVSEYTGLGGGFGGTRRGFGGRDTAVQDDYDHDGRNAYGRRQGRLGGGERLASRSSARREFRGGVSSRYGVDMGQYDPDPSNQGYGARGDRRTGRLGGGLISKVMKKDVLYMMIVPLPTREEMESAEFAPPANASFDTVNI